MGIIRKTVSISTLGLVPFRSKKELLRRSEKDRRAAEAELQREQAARAEADRRVTAAEDRVRRAELTALHEAKVATKAKARSKASRRGRRGRKRASALERLGDLVEGVQPVVEEQAKAMSRRARKAAARAQVKAKALESAMAPHVEVAAERAQALRDDLVERTSAAAAQAKDKAKEKASELVDQPR